MTGPMWQTNDNRTDVALPSGVDVDRRYVVAFEHKPVLSPTDPLHETSSLRDPIRYISDNGLELNSKKSKYFLFEKLCQFAIDDRKGAV